MPTVVPSKYALKSLHEEIALFDRKLAHLEKYETFSSDKERIAAAEKMASKREQLVRAAKGMTEAGIEFQTSDLPRSLRNPGDIEEPVSAPRIEEAAVPTEPASYQAAQPTYQGTVLDFRNSITEYKKQRKLKA